MRLDAALQRSEYRRDSGGYLALRARLLENDIFATVGLVMLIGLSAKNAILIVEFAKSNYESGMSISESALGAARLRFRPIVMTALAFIFGCLPLWIATGAGAASRRILGTVVIGGMFLSTAIGLIFIPATFAVEQSHRFVRGQNTPWILRLMLTHMRTKLPDRKLPLSEHGMKMFLVWLKRSTAIAVQPWSSLVAMWARDTTVRLLPLRRPFAARTMLPW
jgi:predicted RND superfamily exporter protein